MSEKTEYTECPFCDRLFEKPLLERVRLGDSPLEAHIKKDHHKVRIWKGRNAKWIDVSEVKERLKA